MTASNVIIAEMIFSYHKIDDRAIFKILNGRYDEQNNPDLILVLRNIKYLSVGNSLQLMAI